MNESKDSIKEKNNVGFATVDQLEKLIKFIGTGLAAVAGATSILYVIGLIIVNMYLSSFGVRDFSLARVTYLSAGISFFFVHSVPFIVVLGVDFLSIRQQKIAPSTVLSSKKRNPITKPIVSIFAATSFTALMIMSVLLNFMENLSNEFFPTSFNTGFYALLGGLFIGLLSTMIFLDVEKKTIIAFIIFSGLFAIPCALLMWTKTIYPHVDPAFGGGKPISINLVVEDQSKAEVLSNTGIMFNGNKSSTIKLLDDTGDYLIVLLDDGNVAKLDKSLVANIIYQSTPLVDSSTNSIATPSASPEPP